MTMRQWSIFFTAVSLSLTGFVPDSHVLRLILFILALTAWIQFLIAVHPLTRH